MKLVVVLLLVCWVACPTAVQACCCYSLCHLGWKPFNDHCYKYFADRSTANEAFDSCKEYGSYLTSINTQEEQDFVYNLWQSLLVDHTTDDINVNTMNALWIGALKTGSNWGWTDGTTWDYTNWGNSTSPNFPGVWNQPDGTGNCAHMWTHRTTPVGGWNDLYCDNPSYNAHFVCEKKGHRYCFPFEVEWPCEEVVEDTVDVGEEPVGGGEEPVGQEFEQFETA